MKYIFQDSIEFKISKVLSKWKRELLKDFKTYDITTEQWSLLTRLWEKDGISQTQLAHKTSKDLPTITRILNKIEKKGLVKRQSDPNDLRTSLIFLTQKGKELELKLNPIAKQISNKAFKNIKQEDIETLKRVLDDIFINLEE